MALTPADLRILIKRSTNTGEVPTAAPSTDHTDGTWDALDIYKGELFINVADNKLWMRTDSGIVQLYPSAGGITSLNGLTASTQTFAVSTSGTDFTVSSVTSTHTFNLPTASASARGALSSTDWSTFNNKIGGSLTSGRVPYASGTSTLTDTSLFVFDGTKLGIGIASPTATIHSKGSDSTSSNFALKVDNSSSTALLYVRNDGNVGIGTASPGSKLEVNGGSATDTKLGIINSTAGAIVRARIDGDTSKQLHLIVGNSTQSLISTFYRDKAVIGLSNGDTCFFAQSSGAAGAKNIYFVTDNDGFSSPTTRAEMNSSGNWNFTKATGFGQAIGFTSFSAWVDIAASDSFTAHIRLAAGTAPSSPNNGDLWFDGTDVKIRVGGVTKTFTLV